MTEQPKRYSLKDGDGNTMGIDIKVPEQPKEKCIYASGDKPIECNYPGMAEVDASCSGYEGCAQYSSEQPNKNKLIIEKIKGLTSQINENITELE
ncbi:MAG TPA: hypothetical protein ENH82_08505, partial [bacterium]|nr:hypothetical protein [bacterium]